MSQTSAASDWVVPTRLTLLSARTFRSLYCTGTGMTVNRSDIDRAPMGVLKEAWSTLAVAEAARSYSEQHRLHQLDWQGTHVAVDKGPVAPSAQPMHPVSQRGFAGPGLALDEDRLVAPTLEQSCDLLSQGDIAGLSPSRMSAGCITSLPRVVALALHEPQPGQRATASTPTKCPSRSLASAPFRSGRASLASRARHTESTEGQSPAGAIPTATWPMPGQESSHERSVRSARSYEGIEQPSKPTAARRRRVRASDIARQRGQGLRYPATS